MPVCRTLLTTSSLPGRPSLPQTLSLYGLASPACIMNHSQHTRQTEHLQALAHSLHYCVLVLVAAQGTRHSLLRGSKTELSQEANPVAPESYLPPTSCPSPATRKARGHPFVEKEIEAERCPGQRWSWRLISQGWTFKYLSCQIC